MAAEKQPSIRVLTREDALAIRELLGVFSDAFEDPKSYISNQPSDDYLYRLLSRDTFIAVVAEQDGRIIGGLAAYELIKFEQERSEIYIYDLAVSPGHWRRGVATRLIEALTGVAADRGAWVVYVQADHDDPPAIELYTKLGKREDVLHFDIKVAPKLAK